MGDRADPEELSLSVTARRSSRNKRKALSPAPEIQTIHKHKRRKKSGSSPQASVSSPLNSIFDLSPDVPKQRRRSSRIALLKDSSSNSNSPAEKPSDKRPSVASQVKQQSSSKGLRPKPVISSSSINLLEVSICKSKETSKELLQQADKFLNSDISKKAKSNTANLVNDIGKKKHLLRDTVKKLPKNLKTEKRNYTKVPLDKSSNLKIEASTISKRIQEKKSELKKSKSHKGNLSIDKGTAGKTKVSEKKKNNQISKRKSDSKESPVAGSSQSKSSNLSSFYAKASMSGEESSQSLSENHSDGQDNDDVGQLQTLLETRNFLGALGPRMQQILNRSLGTGNSTKAHQLLQALENVGDEAQQLTAVMEMCQMLVMGNEDTLAGFPVKQVVPALIVLVRMQHNFDMMHNACRALTYMLEALPRSSAVVVDAVPALLEKLESIEYMDVAEQALEALQALSLRHSRAILAASGLQHCLEFLDFFSTQAQRAALSITANCCLNMSEADFTSLRGSLEALAQRLTNSDKKSVESVCLCFARLVDSFKHDQRLLKELAAQGLITHVQTLLLNPLVSSQVFIMMVRMMGLICSRCPDLAVVMLKQDVVATINTLLVGNGPSAASSTTLLPRSPQELQEIVAWIGELMPSLPSEGIFCVEGLLGQEKNAQWQWQDDSWHAYGALENRLIEAGHQAGSSELTISVCGRSYLLDLLSMQQVNQDTGTTRAIRRCQAESLPLIDSRAENFRENSNLNATLVQSLFSLLYEVYCSSAGPAIRHSCLQAILRMLYYSESELVVQVLGQVPISCQIAAMLASSETKTVVIALQLTHILMQKLPSQFSDLLLRDGVVHQLRLIAYKASDDEAEFLAPHLSFGRKPVLPSLEFTPASSGKPTNNKLLTKSPVASPSVDTPASCSSGGSSRFGDVLKRKKSSKRSRRSEEKLSPLTRSQLKDTKPKTHFLSSFNPTRWGRSSDRSSKQSELLVNKPPVVNSTACARQKSKEKIKTWIKEQAAHLFSVHFSHDSSCQSAGLSKLREIISCDWCQSATLKQLADVMSDDLSPFELQHAGLIRHLTQFLTNHSDIFTMHFLDLPSSINKPGYNEPLGCLVSKFLANLEQQEQLTVHLDETTCGSSGSRGALRFLNTHQLKCQLERAPGADLRAWKGGPVKIDPLALVQAIERYLVVRGYARTQAEESNSDEDHDSSDELDDPMIALSLSPSKHCLEFLIGGTLLPYNMTVYQAVRQYSSLQCSQMDTDSDSPYGSADMWLQTHIIQYRRYQKRDETPGKKSLLKKSSKIKTVVEELSPVLPPSVTIDDPCLPTLRLLRMLHILSQRCQRQYNLQQPIIDETAWISSKIASKARRQLQDRLVLMTGNLPSWLPQLGYSCQFLLPFETRLMLFYAVSFDRDRAVQKLQDSISDNPQSQSDRASVTRLERRKRIVSRGDVLKQADKLFSEVGSWRAFLEIQYEDEVGSGLGPTLEFYSLVSQDFQRADLELWRGQKIQLNNPQDEDEDVFYISNECGLFPLPLPRSVKPAVQTRIKNRFTLLGRFMAKAVMDSRLLDMHFSPAMYMWLLGKQDSLGEPELALVDKSIARSCQHLRQLLNQEKELLTRPNSGHQLSQLRQSVEDLQLDFVLPGYPNIELKKGGRSVQVALNNLDEYLSLIAHWTLVEGVQRQMTALCDAFNSVFPLSHLLLFYPHELNMVFCGAFTELWEEKQLLSCIKPDHGYTTDSSTVMCLVRVLCSFQSVQQRRFLQFVTGSPRLPVGGLRSLNPPLTIVRKTVEEDESADSFLPSVMTCVNYLKLPEYSCEQVMRLQLERAMSEGQLSFHLS